METRLKTPGGRVFKIRPWGESLANGETSRYYKAAEYEPHESGGVIVNVMLIGAEGRHAVSRDRVSLGEFEVWAAAIMGGREVEASKRFRLDGTENRFLMTPLD